jgi:hypothetical protein
MKNEKEITQEVAHDQQNPATDALPGHTVFDIAHPHVLPGRLCHWDFGDPAAFKTADLKPSAGFDGKTGGEQ